MVTDRCPIRHLVRARGQDRPISSAAHSIARSSLTADAAPVVILVATALQSTRTAVTRYRPANVGRREMGYAGDTHVFRRVQAPAARHRPGRDRGVARRRSTRSSREEGETRARFLIFKLLKRARQLQVGLPPLTQTRYINTISPSRSRGSRATRTIERRIRRVHPLERGGDGRPGQQPVRRHRRPPRHLRLGGDASTRSASTTSSGARTTAAAATRSSSRATPRPGIYARAFLEGRLDRGPARPLPARDRPGPGPVARTRTRA